MAPVHKNAGGKLRSRLPGWLAAACVPFAIAQECYFYFVFDVISIGNYIVICQDVGGSRDVSTPSTDLEANTRGFFSFL